MSSTSTELPNCTPDEVAQRNHEEHPAPPIVRDLVVRHDTRGSAWTTQTA